MDDAEVDRVFAGKVWGAWYLSEAAASLQLDFFVFTSSIAAVWGTRGQIVYGAANAFLDGLAWRLRERGVPGISVQFGLWSTGMGDRETREQLDVIGIRTLSSADALAGMAELITSSAPHGMVARIDWTRFVPFQQLRRKRPLLANIERELPETAADLDVVDGDTVDRRARGRSRPAAQAAGAGVPPQRRRGGDADRRAGDPRRHGVLRSRHGFADGRRAASPARAGSAGSCR